MEQQALLEALLDHAGIADALSSLSLGAVTPVCEACGKETDQRCKGCKLIHYCSIECQHADWKAGHDVECKAIATKEPWPEQLEGSIVMDRHEQRLERIAGGHGGGGGGHGGGGGGGHFGGGGGGRSYPGRGGYGYGRGHGYGYGRGYGFGRGWGWAPFWFAGPWIVYNGMYYPWWFFEESAAAHAAQYGPPPHAPGDWGAAGPPPTGPGPSMVNGVPRGWTSPPPGARNVQAQVGDEILDAGGDDQDLVGLPFSRKGRSFKDLATEHVRLTVDFAKVTKAGRQAQATDLMANAAKWVAKIKDEDLAASLKRLLEGHIRLVGRFIVAKRYPDQYGNKIHALVEELMQMAEPWASLWSQISESNKSKPSKEFIKHATIDMQVHIRDTAVYVEDLMLERNAKCSIDTAVTSGGSMGEYLDKHVAL
jgi:hypothetical protein